MDGLPGVRQGGYRKGMSYVPESWCICGCAFRAHRDTVLPRMGLSPRGSITCVFCQGRGVFPPEVWDAFNRRALTTSTRGSQ